MKTNTHFISQSTLVTVNDLLRLNARNKSWLSGLLNHLSSNVLQAVSRHEEPKISLRRDRSGNEFWHVYDQSTGRSANLASEKDVRIWLEERYAH
jgi:hypothetical protein